MAEAHKLARTGGRGKSAGGFMARSAFRRDIPPIASDKPPDRVGDYMVFVGGCNINIGLP
jgi:hypothetical protein